MLPCSKNNAKAALRTKRCATNSLLAGQANYSMANTALDSIAACAQQCGLPAVSMQWGAWAAGMASNEVVTRKVEHLGMTMIQPQQGLAALERVLSGKSVAVAASLGKRSHKLNFRCQFRSSMLRMDGVQFKLVAGDYARLPVVWCCRRYAVISSLSKVTFASMLPCNICISQARLLPSCILNGSPSCQRCPSTSPNSLVASGTAHHSLRGFKTAFLK